MEEGLQVAYNPYHDLLVRAGLQAFAELFNVEEHFMADKHSKEARNDYLRFRRSAVEFIEKHSRSWKFDALIPYMAMTYVDRYHLNGEIPHVVDSVVENADLFLISCLTIAWKLRTKTFALPNFLNERKLKYSAENVLEMELNICRHLDWRIRTLTPFCFIEFFVPFHSVPPGILSPLLRSVRQLIVKSQFDIAFTEFRPSVMAASAVLTVCSKMFPDEFDLFETHIIHFEFMKPLKDKVDKCNEMLEPLCRKPSAAAAREEPGSAERKPAEPKVAPGEASGSVVKKRSDPIPVPGHEPPPPARPKRTRLPSRLFRSSIPPNAVVEQEMYIYAEENAMQALEEERIRREGKELAAEEGQTLHDPQDIHQLFQVDSGELMSFELGWIEAQADVDRRGVGAAEMHAGSGTSPVQVLTGEEQADADQRGVGAAEIHAVSATSPAQGLTGEAQAGGDRGGVGTPEIHHADSGASLLQRLANVFCAIL